MRKEYNLKKLKWEKNPYIKYLKKPITIRVDEDVLEYFKLISNKEHIPYQSLINSFLRFCKEKRLNPHVDWESKN